MPDQPRAELIAQARALQADPMLPIDKATGCSSTREFVGLLADELERLQERIVTIDIDGRPVLMDNVAEAEAALDTINRSFERLYDAADAVVREWDERGDGGCTKSIQDQLREAMR